MPLVGRAVGFLDQLGLRAGDRLLTLLPNTPETFALGLAAMLEGVVQVALPADLGSSELAPIVADASPHVVALGENTEASAGDIRTVHFGAAALDRSLAREPSARWPRTRPMAYTSGTTGARKGVYVGVHEPRWGEAMVTDELSTFDHRHGDRHLVVSPLYHSGPFRFAAVTALTGGQVAVMPHFSAELFRDALRRLRPASLFCVPTHLRRLLDLPATSADDLASLQLLAHAGAPCPVDLKEHVLELAPEGAVWEFYGSTEGQFTVCSPQVWRTAPGTVGRARPGRTVSVRDPNDDGVGTVWVTAPWHARWEYWRDPVKTAAS
ncbi:MAG: AMP-binding protein, partial [Nitriliruptorales bacterium]|nr:AMP-binding protein [Nitriliruptorales bacterium]